MDQRVGFGHFQPSLTPPPRSLPDNNCTSFLLALPEKQRLNKVGLILDAGLWGWPSVSYRIGSREHFTMVAMYSISSGTACGYLVESTLTKPAKHCPTSAVRFFEVLIHSSTRRLPPLPSSRPLAWGPTPASPPQGWATCPPPCNHRLVYMSVCRPNNLLLGSGPILAWQDSWSFTNFYVNCCAWAQLRLARVSTS